MNSISAKAILSIIAAALGAILWAQARTAGHAAMPVLQEGEQKLKHIEDVHVLLVCDKTKASLKQNLTLDASVRNDGPDDIYLFQSMEWGYGGGMDLYVEDQSGRRVGPTHSSLEPPPTPDDPTVLVRLEQGCFYGFRGHMDVSYLVPREGRYTMKVIYRTPFTRDLLNDRLRKLPILTLEDPPLESNKLVLEVVP